MSAELKASRRDATLILTLYNPAANNALHPDMYAAAIETLTTAERDNSIRAVVITGADRFFCSGGNLNRLLDNGSQDNMEHTESFDHLKGWIEAIRDCPKPVIAAVEGSAISAGFSLALACDLIVAGASAQFLMTYATMGLTPDGAASWFLTQALPRQLVAEILIEGKAVSSTRLRDLGLINKVVADGTALDAALNWADELVSVSPNAIERTKSLIHQAQTNSLLEQFEVEKRNFVESLHHRDAQEGISAFLEKRKPHYK